KGWESQFNLDPSRLTDNQFALFPEAAEAPGYKDLCDLIESSKNKTKVQANKTYKLDSLVSEAEQVVLGIFEEALSAYLKLDFPWEESLLSDSSAFENAQAGLHENGESYCEGDQSASQELQSPSQHALAPKEHDELEFNEGEAKHNSEQKLSFLWTGKRRSALNESELLFDGSEISFMLSADKAFSISTFRHDYSKFSIHVNRFGPKYFGPLLYGKKYTLKALPGQSFFQINVQISAHHSSLEIGPVLISQPLYLQVLTGPRTGRLIIQGGIQVHKSISPHPMLAWMKSLNDSIVVPLRRKAFLVDHFFTTLEENSMWIGYHLDGQACPIPAMLLGKFEEVDTKLPKGEACLVKMIWNDVMRAGNSEQFESPNITSALSLICSSLHKRNRDLYVSKVKSMVIDDIVPLLRLKIQADQKEQMAELERQFREEKSRLLQKLRRQYLAKLEGLPTLSLVSFRSSQARQGYLNKVKGKMMELSGMGAPEASFSIRYSTEVFGKEDLSWMAIEILPMKKDLKILNTNAAHVISPRLNPHSVSLLDVISTETRLAKVVCLKSGQALLFVQKYVGDPLFTIYHCQKLTSGHYGRPIKELKRPVDAMAFDETSRFAAFYAKQYATIRIFFFDEAYMNMDVTGLHLELAQYSGSQIITWMRFVPGKKELVLVDATKCIRLFELTQSVMMRPRQIQLSFPFVKACITADGSYLIVFNSFNKAIKPAELLSEDMDCEQENSCADTGEEVLKRNASERYLELEIYRLDSMLHLKTVPLDVKVDDLANLEANIVMFGPQMHLVIHDSARPDVVWSCVLESSSASEVLQMKVQNNVKPKSAGPEHDSSAAGGLPKSCPELEYVYHIFDKFATSPSLKSSRENDKRELVLKLLLKSSSAIRNGVGADCKKYIEDSLDKLRSEKGKDFSKLDFYIDAEVLEDWLDGRADRLLSKPMVDANMTMGSWLQKLVCLVPIQIARAENNALKPLMDGLQIPPHLNYVDALALADIVRFGFYESVLDGWTGDIKVISSMGKQSSGKSYLLNHLSGSLLDVAGGRCTDGVWMTMRPTEECLYILLDFEGLGSFERSEQEDMLLSIFNAAVSNVTIFNKKDFHLDKETEAIFERFQSGVSLVKEDKKLFQGLFYMGIKDVDSSDVEDLKVEFQEKIAQICGKSQENFLTKMYGGEIEIAAMPPFHRPEYHESINDIAMTVEELPCCHQNGRSFNRDLKLVLSQMSTKDWSPIDSKRVAYKLLLLNKHLGTAIASGCLAAGEGDTVLMNFDSRETISEFVPMDVQGNVFQLADTNVQLAPLENQVIGSILDPLRIEFEQVVARTGEDDEAWHTLFESFLTALAERRKQRVLDWLIANTVDFLEDGEVQKLQMQTIAFLADQQQKLSLCSCKCERCFLRCILERSHPGDHSCKGTHRCKRMCTYCSDDAESSDKVNACHDAAGHEGLHDCMRKSHTCGQTCGYFGKTSNCNKTCTLKAKHEGDHKCNSRQHMCMMECSLLDCKNPCITPFDLGDHSRHACHERMCPEKCTMQGCSRSCCTEDHFHAHNPSVTQHFCGNEHQCYEQCEAPGICEVSTEVVKKTKTFQGKRDKFEYDYVSEQNGKRKDCCIPIPPFMVEHEGTHSHTTNTNAVHFCETRCHSCGYFCNLPINHTGLHNTTHGNMTDVSFVSEVEDIDILDRKYAWGESGMAEMCMMHCKNRGRGHIHLVPCATEQIEACLVGHLVEGARHETRKYGPDFDLPKDELTHAAFWKYMRFEDPCTDDDRNSFALCDHLCPSNEHVLGSATHSSGTQKVSYCEEDLWHLPVQSAENQSSGSQGYVTSDGHRFLCDHSKNVDNHVIFIIDRSRSMASSDCRPTMMKFNTKAHNNRLGCVYEAILRFIRTRMQSSLQDLVSVVLFDGTASIAFEGQPIAETLVDQLLTFRANNGTVYSAGLDMASSILQRSLQRAEMQNKAPVMIFLSDGGNMDRRRDPTNCVKILKQIDTELIFHTIRFGCDPSYQVLVDMAKAGNGSFQISLDEIQLAKSFESLANSLRTKVTSLM
ncbi:hypothetical protein KC19_3G251200, partial [Ceratodon purpureus]